MLDLTLPERGSAFSFPAGPAFLPRPAIFSLPPHFHLSRRHQRMETSEFSCFPPYMSQKICTQDTHCTKNIAQIIPKTSANKQHLLVTQRPFTDPSVRPTATSLLSLGLGLGGGGLLPRARRPRPCSPIRQMSEAVQTERGERDIEGFFK